MASLAMPRRLSPPLPAALSRPERHHLVGWYLAGAVVAFAIPLNAVNLLGLAQPEIAVGAWVPTVHIHRSPIYLPPDLDGDAERGSGTAGTALAAVWIVAAGAVIYAARRRLFPPAEKR